MNQKKPKPAKPFRDMKMEDLQSMIGKTVYKVSGKPFSSRKHTAIVTGVINHPHINVPAFTFEDAKYCAAMQCDEYAKD